MPVCSLQWVLFRERLAQLAAADPHGLSLQSGELDTPDESFEQKLKVIQKCFGGDKSGPVRPLFCIQHLLTLSLCQRLPVFTTTNSRESLVTNLVNRKFPETAPPDWESRLEVPLSDLLKRVFERVGYVPKANELAAVTAAIRAGVVRMWPLNQASDDSFEEICHVR